MVKIISQIKNPWQALYLIFTKRPKTVVTIVSILVVGALFMFNFSFDKKSGVTIKPSIEVKK